MYRSGNQAGIDIATYLRKIISFLQWSGVSIHLTSEADMI